MTTKNRKRTNLTRKLFSEALEPRAMMAADAMHNFLFPHDVDDDGNVTPLDALVVINDLNRVGDDSSSAQHQFHDVDDDSQVTPLDALILINDLNSRSATPPVVEGQEQHFVAKFGVVSGDSRSAEFEQETEKGVTIRQFEAEIEKATPNSRFEVSVGGIVVGNIDIDFKGRGKYV